MQHPILIENMQDLSRINEMLSNPEITSDSLQALKNTLLDSRNRLEVDISSNQKDIDSKNKVRRNEITKYSVLALLMSIPLGTSIYYYSTMDLDEHPTMAKFIGGPLLLSLMSSVIGIGISIANFLGNEKLERGESYLKIQNHLKEQRHLLTEIDNTLKSLDPNASQGLVAWSLSKLGFRSANTGEMQLHHRNADEHALVTGKSAVEPADNKSSSPT